MKPPQLKSYLALAALAAATGAFAQSNGVPGPDDYASFSRFITDRNIFDPNRVPHGYNPNRRTRYVSRSRPRAGAPGIQLVGTMSYEKGMFAFFNSSSMDDKRAAQTGEKIAGYTITVISANDVILESADKKQRLDLKCGDGFRQEDGKWVFAVGSEMPLISGAYATEPSSAASASSESPAADSTAPSPAIEGNDILKRLMEQRQKKTQ